ncbi:hypothetical protein [Poseidonibacter ostreae]|uniref:Uncharacterized protein n=1 Tax=Poseidonibacter ostreae TaxID=2654171 RepID=A0A6L4WN78_9BACT|nr:hypothetical protein [Poseidonibacter ostreae]KAB7881222.1 hypothetical protein GA417_14200 [Poseidonibacter ostreae]KAB7884236.1 hypothetical protein GBG19_16075 [Poseidonibacter ostreae]KAB7886347.1 hypothetical protein GBG18_14710 [Poseidonibacter ostreae]
MSNENANRVVITLNDEEFNNFILQKKSQGKTGQLLGYLAFQKAKLIEKPKKTLKRNRTYL